MSDPLSIALSGLKAATARANAGASNIANANTSGALEGTDGPQPYIPVDVVQTSVHTADGQPQGVKADTIPRRDGTTAAYEPDLPYADDNGLVAVPDVDLGTEIVEIKEAANAYKANAAVIRVTSEMEKALFDRFDQTV